MQKQENQIKQILEEFTNSSVLGRWCKSNFGIKEVITAGLMANIDITKAKTAGAVWRYAGIDPTICRYTKVSAMELLDTMFEKKKNKFDMDDLLLVANKINRHIQNFLQTLKNVMKKPKKKLDEDGDEVESDNDEAETEERPFSIEMVNRDRLAAAIACRCYNSDLKTLLWKMTECFNKASKTRLEGEGLEYTKYLLDRKQYEMDLNEKGMFKAIAEEKAKTVGKSTVAYKSYSIGKLPKGHIQAKAKRQAAKLFLSHYFEIAYFLHYGKVPPLPYILVYSQGRHTDYVRPPNLDKFPELLPLVAAERFVHKV